jgi:hypothetical protein
VAGEPLPSSRPPQQFFTNQPPAGIGTGVALPLLHFQMHVSKPILGSLNRCSARKQGQTHQKVGAQNFRSDD